MALNKNERYTIDLKANFGFIMNRSGNTEKYTYNNRGLTRVEYGDKNNHNRDYSTLLSFIA